MANAINTAHAGGQSENGEGLAEEAFDQDEIAEITKETASEEDEEGEPAGDEW